MTRRWGERRSDRGLVTTELALLFPIVVIVVLLIVQVALWSHANAVAQAAAEHGAEVAAAFGATADDGRTAATGFLDQAGQIDDAVVQAQRVDGQASVTVRGTFPSVFGRLDVAATTTIVVEQVVP